MTSRTLGKALLALALALLLPNGGVQGQNTGTVTGEVIEAATGRTLAGAQVYIPGTTVGALTNASGRFLITNAPTGLQTIRVESVGYGAQTQEVNVPAGQSVAVSFQLRQTAIALDQIVVTGAGVATERRRLGNTISTVDVAQLETVPVSNISEILTGREPGVVGITSGGLTG